MFGRRQPRNVVIKTPDGNIVRSIGMNDQVQAPGQSVSLVVSSGPVVVHSPMKEKSAEQKRLEMKEQVHMRIEAVKAEAERKAAEIERLRKEQEEREAEEKRRTEEGKEKKQKEEELAGEAEAKPRAPQENPLPAIVPPRTAMAFEQTVLQTTVMPALFPTLRSARFIKDINNTQYPSNILPPNPALNMNAPPGKFKYDRNFLLQFQSVVTQKPSVDWDQRIPEILSDPLGYVRTSRRTGSRNGLLSQQLPPPPRGTKLQSFVPQAKTTTEPGVPSAAFTSLQSTPFTEDINGGTPPPRKSKPQPFVPQTKPATEPCLPSAALTALRSARFIEDINSIQYPNSVHSPNPALNQNAPPHKFKYGKDFLLQFQPAFTEKPSLDWDQRIRETIGDPADYIRPSKPGAPNSSLPIVVSTPPISSLGSFNSGKRFLPANMNPTQRFELPTVQEPRAHPLPVLRPVSPWINSSASLSQQANTPQSALTRNRSKRGSKRGRTPAAPSGDGTKKQGGQ